MVAGTWGTFFGKYGIMGIKYKQSGNVHGIMAIKFKTRRNFGIIICMNMTQCDESNIFINYNKHFHASHFSNSDTELWPQFFILKMARH